MHTPPPPCPPVPSLPVHPIYVDLAGAGKIQNSAVSVYMPCAMPCAMRLRCVDEWVLVWQVPSLPTYRDVVREVNDVTEELHRATTGATS